MSIRNLFSKKQITANEKLSTGSVNWRLKQTINSVKDYPNFIAFLKEVEDRDNCQIGLDSDVVDQTGVKVCNLRQWVYNLKGDPLLYFTFSLIFSPVVDAITFVGYIFHVMNKEDYINPKKEYFAIFNTEKNTDLTIDEYKKYYDESFEQALSIQGYNPAEFSRIRGNGKECMNKLYEQEIREKYPN